MRVFLTGASSGIGEALARHYAARGDTLGLVDGTFRILRRIAEVNTRAYPSNVILV